MKTLIYIFLSMLIITTFCQVGYAESVVTDGLVSYWTFDRQDIADNTVKDVWGKNDGTIFGDPKVVAGPVKVAGLLFLQNRFESLMGNGITLFTHMNLT